MDITYRKTPLKRLLRMQPARAKQIRRSLEAIAADPSGVHANLKPLKGVSDGFRMRVGDWRVSTSSRLNLAEERIDGEEADKRQGAEHRRT
jgi:mRNA-degrading endonuclease RelE of RelBE toxin-antitoxin system